MADTGRMLYWGSGSPPCWKVMIALEEKGLAYESKLLEFGKREHKSPEVLALNPRGQLPTFRDANGVVVNDSLAALLYLEDAYPQPALTPPRDDAAARGLTWQRMAEAIAVQDKLSPPARMKMRGLVKTDEDKVKFEDGVAEAKAELQRWEGYLAAGGEGAFAAGPSFSIADVCLAPMLASVQRYGGTLEGMPALKAYAERVQARPSMLKTWPPHWKTSPAQTWLTEYL